MGTDDPISMKVTAKQDRGNKGVDVPLISTKENTP